MRGGGHSWAAWALRDDALLIDLCRMREIVPMDDDAEIVAVVAVGARRRGARRRR